MRMRNHGNDHSVTSNSDPNKISKYLAEYRASLLKMLLCMVLFISFSRQISYIDIVVFMNYFNLRDVLDLEKK